MGKEVRFLNSVKNIDGTYNVTYGVEDFNKITSCLIGSGVAPFPGKDTYAADELNAMTEAVVNSGTSLDGLKVTFADNVITIAQGIGFFNNGATIEVDSEGVMLDYTVANTVYVYAAYDASLNVCDFYASDAVPEETDAYFVINLAEISAEGIVTDKRVFAQSKIATLGRNVFKQLWRLTEGRTYKKGDVFFETEIDVSRFNYLVYLWVYDSSSSGNPKTSMPIYERKSIEKLKEGAPLYLSSGAYVVLEGSRIKVYMDSSWSSSEHYYAGSEIFLC